ncbi:MAG: PLDc N-terminal domain-containing protein [Oscillospiraceae bacterium]|nr:PLDc N-terminal domain-containing protein [Oscillospiraceae bacterium]
MPENMMDFLPFLIPVIVIQVGLTLASLIHVLTHKTYRRGNRILWVLVSFISIIGPVLYFTLGKGDE